MGESKYFSRLIKHTWINMDGFILDAIRHESSIVTIWPFTIYENTIWYPKIFSSIQSLP